VHDVIVPLGPGAVFREGPLSVPVFMSDVDE
jgi:hypothetical protein